MELQFDINDKKIVNALDKIPLELREKGLKGGLYFVGSDLARYIIEKHLSGGGDDSLEARTGRFRQGTRGMTVKVEGTLVIGGVAFGVKYAKPHVGKKGKITVIKPKSSKNLAIPLDPAKTKGGAAKRPSPRNYKDLQFMMSEKGQKLLVKIDKETKEVTPYFLLVSSVKIPTRIHPEDIFEKRKANIMDAMILGINKIMT